MRGGSVEGTSHGTSGLNRHQVRALLYRDGSVALKQPHGSIYNVYPQMLALGTHPPTPRIVNLSPEPAREEYCLHRPQPSAVLGFRL